VEHVVSSPPQGAGVHRGQGRRLWRVVHRVPAYRALWSAAGIDPDTIRLPEELHRLPVVTRRDLLRFSSADRCSPGLPRSGTPAERGRATSGEALEVLLDRATRRRRERRFFKALLDCGYRPGQRLLLLSLHDRTGPARHLNWRHVPVSLGAPELAAAYRSFRPVVLYGPLHTLLMLAAALAGDVAQEWPRPRVVISTAGELTPLARNRLRDAFGVEPADFYGMRETGLLAWRAGSKEHFRLAQDEFLFEFLPSATDPGFEHVVLTDLERPAMPLVRFDTGDLARRDGGGDHSAAEAAVVGFKGAPPG
jgi:phenylacetate-CoA ligase